MEDGKEISKQYHRSSFAPESDVSGQPQNVQDICNIAWTDEVISAYQAQVAQELANRQAQTNS
jgi:hypothetical protein